MAAERRVAGALGARLVVLDDCGHVPYVERRETLFAVLRSFLRAGPGAAPSTTP